MIWFCLGVLTGAVLVVVGLAALSIVRTGVL